MKTIVLHLGLSKTGSSFLQSCFSIHRALLLTRGVYYPDHASLAAASRNRITSGNGTSLAKWLNPGVDLASVDDAFLDQLLEDVSASDCQTILYSSEFLSLFIAERMTSLQLALAERDIALRCVGYYRSPMGDAWSNYCQGLKRHLYICTFSEYLQDGYGMPLLDLLDRLESCFDAGAYHLRNYDVVKHKLFEDFLEHGVAITAADLPPARADATINRALTAFEVELLRQFNSGFDDPALSRYISDTLLYHRTAKSDEQFATPEHVTLLEQKFGTELAALNSRLAAGHKLVLVEEAVKLPRESAYNLSEFELAMVAILSRVVEDVTTLQSPQSPESAVDAGKSPAPWKEKLKTWIGLTDHGSRGKSKP